MDCSKRVCSLENGAERTICQVNATISKESLKIILNLWNMVKSTVQYKYAIFLSNRNEIDVLKGAYTKQATRKWYFSVASNYRLG